MPMVKWFLGLGFDISSKMPFRSEQCTHGARHFARKSGIVVQAGVAYVIQDADGEMVLGLGFRHLVEDALQIGTVHARCPALRSKKRDRSPGWCGLRHPGCRW